MKKGLSILELLTTLVIIGIIASITIPIVTNVIENSRKEAFIADIYALKSASELYCVQNSSSEFCNENAEEDFRFDKIKYYVSKDFIDYNKAIVTKGETIKVNLKNDNYETRCITTNNNLIKYSQIEGIETCDNIEDYVVKNKN